MLSRSVLGWRVIQVAKIKALIVARHRFMGMWEQVWCRDFKFGSNGSTFEPLNPGEPTPFDASWPALVLQRAGSRLLVETTA